MPSDDLRTDKLDFECRARAEALSVYDSDALAWRIASLESELEAEQAETKRLDDAWKAAVKQALENGQAAHKAEAERDEAREEAALVSKGAVALISSSLCEDHQETVRSESFATFKAIEDKVGCGRCLRSALAASQEREGKLKRELYEEHKRPGEGLVSTPLDEQCLCEVCVEVRTSLSQVPEGEEEASG